MNKLSEWISVDAVGIVMLLHETTDRQTVCLMSNDIITLLQPSLDNNNNIAI